MKKRRANIKQVLAKGRPLTRSEKVEFITGIIWMGYPQPVEPRAEADDLVGQQPVPSKRRGPKSKKTQYDLALERRKRPYQLLKRLPASGEVGRLEIGDRRRERVKAIADKLRPHTKPHKLVSAILERLEADQQPCDESTVRRALRQLGYGRLK